LKELMGKALKHRNFKHDDASDQRSGGGVRL